MSDPVHTSDPGAALDNVDRIPMPDREGLWTRYVKAQRPVVLTGALDGQPIRDVQTLHDVETLCADSRVQLKDEHSLQRLRLIEALRAGRLDPGDLVRSTEGSSATLGAYIAGIGARQGVGLAVRGSPTPPELLSRCRLPFAGGAAQVESELFVANAGNVTRLHFDIDYKHWFMYHVCGAKRYVLIPAHQACKLNPIFAFSGVLLHELTEAEQRDFLRFAGAWDTIVYPGEILFVPATTWHGVWYLEHSVSFNLRLEASEYASAFARHVHVDFQAQNVVSRLFLDRDAIDDERMRAFGAVVDAVSRPYPSASAKYQAVHEVLRELYARHCVPPASAGRCFFANVEPIEALPFYKADYESSHARGISRDRLPPDFLAAGIG